MKYLKIFEEFKLGVVYTSEEDSVSKIDVNGFEVIFIDHSTSSDYKMIYTVEILGSAGTLTVSGLCFSNVDEAKEYIKQIIAGNKEQGPLPKDKKFVIRGLMLDNGSVSSSNKKDVEKSDEVVNATKIHDFLDKNFNIILNAYIAICPQKYQKTINESSVRTALEKLRRECKSGDSKRCKEAISVFNNFIKDMMLFITKDNNYKNIETWKLSYNGKKYFSLFSEFHKMIGHQYF